MPEASGLGAPPGRGARAALASFSVSSRQAAGIHHIQHPSCSPEGS